MNFEGLLNEGSEGSLSDCKIRIIGLGFGDKCKRSLI